MFNTRFPTEPVQKTHAWHHQHLTHTLLTLCWWLHQPGCLRYRFLSVNLCCCDRDPCFVSFESKSSLGRICAEVYRACWQTGASSLSIILTASRRVDAHLSLAFLGPCQGIEGTVMPELCCKVYGDTINAAMVPGDKCHQTGKKRKWLIVW